MRSQLITEARDGIFAGHFSELKVYHKLRCLFWFLKVREEVRKFFRTCLNCASKKGPGQVVHPPPQPILTKGSFHEVGVNVLKMPLSSSLFLPRSRFMKWESMFYGLPNKVGGGLRFTRSAVGDSILIFWPIILCADMASLSNFSLTGVLIFNPT